MSNKKNPNFQQELDKMYALLMATFDWKEYSGNLPNYYEHRNRIEKHRNTYSQYYKQGKYQNLVKGFALFSEPYKRTFDTLYEAYILKKTGIQINILDGFQNFELKIYKIVKKGTITSMTMYEDAQTMIDFIILNDYKDDTLLPVLRKLTNTYIEKLIKKGKKNNFVGTVLTINVVV